MLVWQPLQSPRSGGALSKRGGARVIAGGGAVLGEHPDVGRGLVAGLAAAHGGGHRGVTGHVQGRAEMLAAPSLKPPALTFVVVWQPEPLQSRLPIGMWLPGVLTIVMLTNGPTVGP